MQHVGVFNVNIVFTFLNVHCLNRRNDSQHSLYKSWHFLRPTFSLVNFDLVSNFWRLGNFYWVFITLMFSNPRTLFLFLCEILNCVIYSWITRIKCKNKWSLHLFVFLFFFLSSFFWTSRAFLKYHLFLYWQDIHTLGFLLILIDALIFLVDFPLILCARVKRIFFLQWFGIRIGNTDECLLA